MNIGLPELVDMIPKFGGAVYAYHGKTHFHPDDLQAVMDWWLPDSDKQTDLIRVGFKVYEILEFQVDGVFLVRHFRCSLNKSDLMKLSEQA